LFRLNTVFPFRTVYFLEVGIHNLILFSV
jgi:hypothetical protein